MEIKKKIIIIIASMFIIGIFIELKQTNEAVGTTSENVMWKELADNWNQTGLDLVNEGKVEEGIEYFQKALIKAEDYKEVGIDWEITKGTLLSNCYNNLGFSYYLLYKYDLSKDYLEKALATEPNDAIEHSNMGNTYLALELYEEAMKQYDLSLEYDSKLSYALYGKATLYYDQYEYDKALELFNQYLEQIPDDRDTIEFSIYCNLYLSNLDKALELANESIDSFQDNYDFFVARGVIYERTKSYEELEQYYKELAYKFNDDMNAQIKLGEFYYNNEEYQAALNQFLTTQNQDQDNPELNSWLIECYTALEDFEGLYEYYYAITDVGKATEQLCIDVGYAYYDSTYYMESLPFFEDAIKINPESEDAHINILQALYYGKRYQRGIEFGMAAEQKFNTNYDIPAYIGDYYYSLGEYDNAIIAYKRALVLCPDNVYLLAYIGDSYLCLNDLQNAKTFTEKALSIDSMNQTAKNTKSIINDKKKELNIQIRELIKENYLYYSADTVSDKTINQLLNKDTMSNLSIASAVDRIRMTEDIFTYTLYDEYYDEYSSLDTTNDVVYEDYGDINYLRIYGFNLNTDSKVIEILDSIKNSQNEILAIDLRGNGGGLIQGATNILDVLLGECVTCSLVYRDGSTYNYYSDASQIKFKEVYLFVDEDTASSSELLTLGLKTYLNNVTVLGQNTYGKGVGQITYEDKERKLALILVNFYWNIRQQNLVGSYITPDIYINSDRLEDYIKVIN